MRPNITFIVIYWVIIHKAHFNVTGMHIVEFWDTSNKHLKFTRRIHQSITDAGIFKWSASLLFAPLAEVSVTGTPNSGESSSRLGCFSLLLWTIDLPEESTSFSFSRASPSFTGFIFCLWDSAFCVESLGLGISSPTAIYPAYIETQHARWEDNVHTLYIITNHTVTCSCEWK